MGKIIGIVAIAKNYTIGNSEGIPWYYKADLQHFKETTTNHTVVMGRKTFETIGKALPNRLNIVLSRTLKQEEAFDNLGNPLPIVILDSKEKVLDLEPHLSANIYIIGGKQIYEEFADEIQEWLVTTVPQNIEGDVKMNKDFLQNFRQTGEKELEDGLRVKTYERRTD